MEVATSNEKHTVVRLTITCPYAPAASLVGKDDGYMEQGQHEWLRSSTSYTPQARVDLTRPSFLAAMAVNKT